MNRFSDLLNSLIFLLVTNRPVKFSAYLSAILGQLVSSGWGINIYK